jgi:hypothetical protein
MHLIAAIVCVGNRKIADELSRCGFPETAGKRMSGELIFASVDDGMLDTLGGTWAVVRLYWRHSSSIVDERDFNERPLVVAHDMCD